MSLADLKRYARLYGRLLDAARAALTRRLDLLDDALRRGIHTTEEYDRLRAAIIAEQSLAWPA